MRVVSEAKEKIARLWGTGKIENTEYRLLTYILTADVEDGTLFHNVVTGEMIHLDPEEAQNIRCLPCRYAPWMDELIKKHFLVKTGADDKKNVDNMRLALRTLGATNAITSYTVLPTTNCNARCFYCYEAGIKHENMSDETADKLVEFMDTHRAGKPIHVRWFGGEPLVGMRQIDRISSALSEREIPFTSSMISNGYLFDEEVVSRAKDSWHLKKIQITLDGTEKIYNETKAYKSAGESPYYKVLKNIDFLLQNDIHVTIRLNFGPHNSEDLTDLITELSDYYSNKKGLSVYSYILFDDCGFAPVHIGDNEFDLLHKKKEHLDDYIYQCSLSTENGTLPTIILYHCMADSSSSIVVLPSGKIGKCEHYSETHFVGSLEEGLTDKKEMCNFEKHIDIPECEQCPLYPSCIKLALCEPNNRCISETVKLRKKRILRTMRSMYKYVLPENES